jgi:glycosyltransferase involved in cell wall biosynthesis
MVLRPDPTSPASEVFYALREVGSTVRRLPERRAARRRAAAVTVSSAREPRPNYGRVEESGAALPIGGEVKLGHLRARFGDHTDGFNLLYLVSSALPPQVMELVRVAKARGAKLVWNQNGIAYPGFYGDFYPWFNRTMAALLPWADHVVYQSRFCRESADRYLGQASCSREILFNPVDLEKFRPRETALPDSTWELLCAGTSHSFYRVKAPLEALRILRDRGRPVRLTIAGEFRWRGGSGEVARCIRDLGLQDHVVLRPPFTQDEAPALYQSAHLLLHGKDKDPCPTVPIEAMACGLPVVGLASGGLPELVPDSAGRLVSVPQSWTVDHAADPGDMADAVEALMGNLAEFSRGARTQAEENFDVQPWLDRHAAIFAEVLAR